MLIRCEKWAASGILQHPRNCHAARSPQGPGLLSGGQSEPAEQGQPTHPHLASGSQATLCPRAPSCISSSGSGGNSGGLPRLSQAHGSGRLSLPGDTSQGFLTDMGYQLDPPPSGAWPGERGLRATRRFLAQR